MSLGDRADDAQLVFAVAGVVVNEFADPRPRVVGGDEGELVRVLSRAFDCADEDFLHGHVIYSVISLVEEYDTDFKCMDCAQRLQAAK